MHARIQERLKIMKSKPCMPRGKDSKLSQTSILVTTFKGVKYGQQRIIWDISNHKNFHVMQLDDYLIRPNAILNDIRLQMRSTKLEIDSTHMTHIVVH